MGSHDQQYWDVLGHRRVLHYLQSILMRQQVISAYLFCGSSQVGKSTTARLFLKCLLCHTGQSGVACGHCDSCKAWGNGVHPDAAVLDDGSDSIGIDAIRGIQQLLSRRPSLSGSSVAFIKRAERLTKEASNALLKTLEDTPKDAVLVLTSDKPELLPATLRSRCQELEFCLVAETEILNAVLKLVPNREQALAITRLAFGRPGRAMSFSRHPLAFQEYSRDVDNFLKILALPVSERQSHVQEFLGSDNKQPVQNIERILQTWMLLLRDMMFARLNLQDYITHTAVRENLAIRTERFSLHHIVRLASILQRLISIARYHVQPQLLIENFFLHL